ncbi:hypothetical protein A2U01_0003557 [Trifolium medium]|uniref:Uncharacterized protein n=1 Tax=Trifolium medium TaxID=97028 RepID=A0A392M5W9_9FABA|nr:hypothetical protein [Trifolium medium]
MKSGGGDGCDSGRNRRRGWPEFRFLSLEVVLNERWWSGGGYGYYVRMMMFVRGR